MEAAPPLLRPMRVVELLDASIRLFRHDSLRRELARPWRLNPDQPDDTFVAELARCRDDLDSHAFRKLLARLAGDEVSEAELVRLVGEVGIWLEQRES
jgi:hypothetical protein